MKILHTVEFYYPSIGGAQEVVRHLSERMVASGHEVYVATTKLSNRTSIVHNGVNIVEFDISGNEVNGFKGKDVARYKKFLETEKFDVVMNYAAQQWTADIFMQVMHKVSAKKVFVPCGFSALYDEAYADYFHKMPSRLAMYDSIVFLSNDYRDINFAREHKIENICIIPNGADENEFSELITEEEKRFIRARYGLGGLVITTIGNHTNEKGHKELLRVFKALPYASATLAIIGTIKPHDGCYDVCEIGADTCNNSKKFFGKRIILVDGENREDVKKILQSTDIFAFFSNIECSPLVLFETAAAGVPFIASAAGNNEEIARWTGNGVIIKSNPRPNGRVEIDKKDALLKLTRLAYDKKQRKQLGTTGHSSWKKTYTWEKLTEQYVSLYSKITEK